MSRGFRLAGDNAYAALTETIRSRMRADESRHRIVGTDDYAPPPAPPGLARAPLAGAPPAGGAPNQRAKADAAASARLAGSSADAASSPPIYPLVGMCRAAGLPEPVPEYQFHPRRKWRLDFAWPIHRIGIAVEGGIWSSGRHTRGSGYLADMAKYNAATMLGWRLLRYAPDQLGQALGDLRIMFAGDAA